MMRYLSTRDKNVSLSGGLLTPEMIPEIDEKFLLALSGLSYPERAAKVMALYLTDYTEDELLNFAREAYGPDGFDDTRAAPAREVDKNLYCLELWHGPTSAFKDMALQMLPRLLSAALKKTGESRTACILVATSGDTGKAAMEGFADVDQTKIFVFYPKDGVSKIQELQMVTQAGQNVGVCAVKGNFDDAQTGVKQIFSDVNIREILNKRGYFLSSANSINWGRILPQLVYYFSAYCDLLRENKIKIGEKINICVPTGNFGDILAAWYAKQMGLPVGKLICASNRNDVLTEFIKTGVYNRDREFYTTMSPSMDILISSNLERLLYHLSGENDMEVRAYMRELSESGKYEIQKDLKSKLQAEFWGGYCDEAGTSQTIGDYWKKYHYLIDTHTAVAANVLEQYREATGDDHIAVFASTASPYKFCGSVLNAIGENPDGDGVELLEKLYQVSGVKIPARLADLKNKTRRFDLTAEKSDMDKIVLDFLK